MSVLTVVPCTLREANAFVSRHHRHHRPARGCRFTLAVARPGVREHGPRGDLCEVACACGHACSHHDGGGECVVPECGCPRFCGEPVVCGVAVAGRPVARLADDGWTLEVTRVCTDGTPNACSALYGACRRAAFALGYRRLITYTLPAEGGASLRGAGWRLLGVAGGGSWSRRERPRVDTHPTGQKLLWEA